MEPRDTDYSERPTVGRIVHYHDGKRPHVLAFVNAAPDDAGAPGTGIGLELHPPAANGARIEAEQVYVAGVPGDEPGEWHWPERA